MEFGKLTDCQTKNVFHQLVKHGGGTTQPHGTINYVMQS